MEMYRGEAGRVAEDVQCLAASRADVLCSVVANPATVVLVRFCF